MVYYSANFLAGARGGAINAPPILEETVSRISVLPPCLFLNFADTTIPLPLSHSFTILHFLVSWLVGRPRSAARLLKFACYVFTREISRVRHCAGGSSSS